MSAKAAAGGSVRDTARRHYWGAAGMTALAMAVLASAGAIAAAGGHDVSILLGGLGVWLVLRASGRYRDASSYRLGAIAEERVAADLTELEDRGWIVEHDVRKRGRGNIDHVVHSPCVTFTIETKRSRWSGENVEQANRHADWASRTYGHRSVIPVICIQRSRRDTEVRDGVFIVGGPYLVDLLLDHGG